MNTFKFSTIRFDHSLDAASVHSPQTQFPTQPTTRLISSTSATSRLDGKRLLICEEALCGFHAHYYSWIKSIRQLNQEAGAEVIVAGNTSLDDSIVEEFNAHKIYSVNSWTGIYQSNSAWKRYLGVFKHNLRVYRETATFLKQLEEPVDCLMLPAVRIHHLIAWRLLCARFLGKKFRRLVIFILTSEATYNEDYSDYHFKRSAKLIQSVLKSFAKHVQAGRVLLAGDSHITNQEYTQLSGLPFRLFPSPGVALARKQGDEPEQASEETGGPVFCIMGVSYYDKGIDLLQTAATRYLEEHPDGDARFILQWASKTIDHQGNQITPNDTLRNSKQVTLLEKALTNEEYEYHFRQANFVCLPYRKKSYFNRSSGVFIEAACSGIPLIVTEGTWLSWALEEFAAGVTVEHDDANDLYRKILHCIENWDTLKKQAEERRPKALEINSSDNYLRCLWEV